MEELYNALFSSGDYTKSFEEFKKQFSNEESVKALYGALNQSQDYTKSFDDFKSQFGFETLDTAKITPQEAGAPVEEVSAPDMESPSEDTSLESPKTEQEEKETYLDQLKRVAALGSVELGKGISGFPKFLYDVAAIPQNLLSDFLGIDMKTDSEKFSETIGVKNKILEYYEQESEKLEKESQQYKAENYEKQGIVESFQAGNYGEGFAQLGEGIVQSAPFSLSMMVGGAATTAPRLSAYTTAAVIGPEFEEQKEKGKGEIEALSDAFTISAAETVFSSIGSGTLGKVYKDIILKEGTEAGKQVFRKGLIEMYEGALKKYGAPAGAFGEGIEEVATTITQNLANDLDAFENIGDSFIQGVAGGTVYSAPITAINAKNKVKEVVAESKVNKIIKDTEYKDVSDVYKDTYSVDKTAVKLANNKNTDIVFKKNIKEKLEKKEITEQEASELVKNYNDTNSAIRKTNLFKSIRDEAKSDISSLLIEKQRLNERINKIDDKALSSRDIERVKEIDNKLAEIIDLEYYEEKISLGKDRTLKDIELIRKEGASPVELYDTQEEFYRVNQAAREQKEKIDEIRIKDGKGRVQVAGFRRANGVLVINLEGAALVENFSVGSHELLHNILRTTFLDKEKSQQIVDDFRKIISKQKGFEKIEKSLENYEKGEGNLEEIITQTNDAIRDGVLKLDDTVFQKIKRFIEKIFEGFGFVKGKFDSAEDLVEFLKTYTDSFEKGKKLSKRAVNLAKQGSGIVMQEDIASIDNELFDLQDMLASGEISQDQYDSRVDRLMAMEENIPPVVASKKSPSDFKSTLDTLGRDFEPTRQIPQLAFHPDVRKTIQTIVTIKSKQRGLTNLPNFDMEDFSSQVYENMVMGKKNKDGSIGPGYLQVFDPSINDSFYGYINAQINNRMNSVLKQGEITREKFASQVDQEIGLSDNYDFSEEIDIQDYPQEDIDDGLINPIHLLEESLQKEALQEATEKIEKITIDDLIFKKTPNLVVSTLAKQFNVRESVIEKASQNLNTSELESTAPVINQIAEFLIKILPEGAIIGEGESLAISEKLIGTGTGLPRKILEAFYEKRRRLVSSQEGIGRKGAGLEPFMRIENISKKDFLEKLGINEDGTHNPDIKPKSPESQTRRAILDLFGKLISNVSIRQYMKDNGVSIVAINNLAAGKNPNMYSFRTEKITEKDIAAVIDFKDFSEEFKEEFRRLHPHIDIDGDTRAILNQMILNLLEEKSTTARIRQLFYNNPIAKDRIEKLGINPQEVLDSHDATGQKRGFLTINGIKTTQKHAIQMSKFWPRFSGITPARIRGLWGLDERSFVYGDKKQNVIANDEFKNKKGELTIQILDGTVEEKLDAMMNGKEANSAIENTESFKYTPKQKEYIKKINDFLSKNKIVNRYFYTNQLSTDLNKIIKTDESFKNLTEEQKQEFVEKEIDKAKKYNSVKQDIIRLHLSMLSSYVREKGISKAERLERVVYAIRLLSNTAGGIKDLALIKSRGNMIGPSTFNKGVYKSGPKKGQPKTAVRIEHLISTGFQDVTHMLHVLTGDLPIHMYKSGITDNDLSIAMDDKYIKVIMKDGTAKFISFQTGAIKARFEELALRASEAGLKRFSIREEVSLVEKQDFSDKENFMDLTMGNILKQLTGIPVSERVSQSTAKIMATNRNKKWRLLSPSADDFVGLLYSTLGKGKVGDAQLKFYKKYLIDPFNRANHAMDSARQKISRNYKDLNKEYEVVKKSLNKKSGYKDYTNDHAIRVYLYKKAGASNSSLSINEADENALLNIVRSNPEFEAYANYLMEIAELDNSWIEPSPNWVVGSVFDDMNSIIDRLKRAEYLSEWKENVNIIFSENNRNKLEGYFGEDYRRALDDMLYRMEKGKAIPEKMNKEMNRFQQWLTGSVAVTMFLNRRSAVLQTISNINYLNWSDNNPIAAAKAFANTPQFAKDFALIFNSDYLKQRRGGLKTEVEAAVLANELRKGGVEGMRGAINKLLKAGFTLTQLGDSFAISFGGASFYRNRKNSYLKQGLTEQEARDQAFLDFREISEESQQSARPDRLSMQQTNSIGRVFLAFQNTPMQYYRLIAKAIMDIKNGRGDLKTNISKIAYYGIAQNLMFTAMQQALFAFLFDAPDDDEEQETKDEKVLRTINNSIDTIIRGTGYYGAIVSTIKNVMLEFAKQEKKGFKADHAYTMIQALNLSAPIGIKARTLYQGAYQNYKYNKEIIDDLGYDIDNPGYDIVSSLISFGVNVPIDKVIQMTRGIKEASDKDNEAWQRIALALGWSTWNLGMPNEKIEEAKKIKTKRKRDEAAKKRKQKSSSFSKSF